MLEQLVRPFQSPQPIGTRRIIATSIKLPTQTTHLAWGKAGALPTPLETPAEQPAVGVNFKIKKEDQKLKEKSREIEKVKVVQEDNEDNCVVIQRVKSITFGNTKKEQTLLTPPVAGSTTTAVKRPVTDNGGDIPVTVVGDTLFVDKRNLPDRPGYFEIGDRVFELINTPGPNEVPL